MTRHKKTSPTTQAPESTPGILIGKHYTPKELASILGVTIQMLTHLRLKGRGPKYIKFGYRSIIYSAADVEKYLKERERLSTSDTGYRSPSNQNDVFQP
jgi:hypothetical protein